MEVDYVFDNIRSSKKKKNFVNLCLDFGFFLYCYRWNNNNENFVVYVVVLFILLLE